MVENNEDLERESFFFVTGETLIVFVRADKQNNTNTLNYTHPPPFCVITYNLLVQEIF